MKIKYVLVDELSGKPVNYERVTNNGDIKVRLKSVSISDCYEPGEDAEMTMTLEVLFDQS